MKPPNFMRWSELKLQNQTDIITMDIIGIIVLAREKWEDNVISRGTSS